MFAIKKLLSLPFAGGEIVAGMITKLESILPGTENMPSLVESVKNAETPLDLLIDYVNFWARFTGIDLLKIDRSKGYIISWEEMNSVWRDVLKILKKNASLPVSLIKAVWVAIANMVPHTARP